MTAASGGGVVFRLEVKLGTLLTFLLGTPCLLGSSGSTSLPSVLLSLSLCLFLAPVTLTREPVGVRVLVPPNLDLVLPLPAVGGGWVSDSGCTNSGCSSTASSNRILERTLERPPTSTRSGLTRTLWRPLKAEPVVSDSAATRLAWPGLVITPVPEIGSMEMAGGMVKVGVLCEVCWAMGNCLWGNCCCCDWSTGNLGAIPELRGSSANTGGCPAG